MFINIYLSVHIILINFIILQSSSVCLKMMNELPAFNEILKSNARSGEPLTYLHIALRIRRMTDTNHEWKRYEQESVKNTVNLTG